jgi:hypothetical protein
MIPALKAWLNNPRINNNNNNNPGKSGKMKNTLSFKGRGLKT